jgi:hypothetical protein
LQVVVVAEEPIKLVVQDKLETTEHQVVVQVLSQLVVLEAMEAVVLSMDLVELGGRVTALIQLTQTQT